MQPDIVLRPLKVEDLPAVAEIHRQAFPESALTRLGHETVRRYYEWQMVGPHDLAAIGAFLDDRMVGFSFGGRFNGAIIGFLRRNKLFLAWQVLSHFWLFTDELFRSRASRGLQLFSRLLRPRPVAQIPNTGLPPAAAGKNEYGILSIAVDPRMQGHGIGRILMISNEAIAQRRGFPAMGLNVSTGNNQAIRFYQSLGWEKTLSDEGDWKGKMRKYFNGSAATEVDEGHPVVERDQKEMLQPEKQAVPAPVETPFKEGKIEGSNRFPSVTVIMPIRNEGDYIAAALEAVLKQDYPSDRLKILVVDGMSTDNTRQVVASYSREYPNIQLLDNPGRIVPTGMNIALQQARGDIIIRVDGHCIISPHYIKNCVRHLQGGDFSGVGGPMETIGETYLAQGIAVAMSSNFGVGGSAFRTGKNRPMLVETVAFPAYPRSVIEKAGLYDEEMVRNQDDEYNYRLLKLGGKILLSPDIRSRYYSRSSFKSLWRQYFQYGFWKVRVMQKHPRQLRPRQFIPPLFVAALIGSTALALFTRIGRLLFALVSVLYLIANFAASILTAARRGWNFLPILPIAFSILHVSYGLGFLTGLLKFANRWKERKRH